MSVGFSEVGVNVRASSTAAWASGKVLPSRTSPVGEHLFHC